MRLPIAARRGSRFSLPGPFQQVDRTHILYQNRRYSYFGGCDYFRLASDPALAEALCRAAKEIGLNVAASRMTTGDHRIYRELESALARFFGAPSAVLTSSGYVSNLVAAQALAGEFDLACIDALSHGSLRDAVSLLGCPIREFHHRDPEHLRRVIARAGRRSVLIATDGLFAHDGSVAPLRNYLSVAPNAARFLVDDAHAAGILGERGQGSLERQGVDHKRIVQTVTLSKAFGAYGGAVLGDAGLREKIWSKSRLAVGSTPLPLPLAQASLEALWIVRDRPELRRRLEANARWVKDQLRARGWPAPATPGPIIGWRSAHLSEMEKLEARLLRKKILPPWVRHYGGAPSGGFRFVISSEHRPRQLADLVDAIVPPKIQNPKIENQ